MTVRQIVNWGRKEIKGGKKKSYEKRKEKRRKKKKLILYNPLGRERDQSWLCAKVSREWGRLWQWCKAGCGCDRGRSSPRSRLLVAMNDGGCSQLPKAARRDSTRDFDDVRWKIRSVQFGWTNRILNPCIYYFIIGKQIKG